MVWDEVIDNRMSGGDKQQTVGDSKLPHRYYSTAISAYPHAIAPVQVLYKHVTPLQWSPELARLQ